MCGITGWIDYHHNISNEKKTLIKMVQTLAKRGPDAEGMHFSSHAALGHRRLCVIDPDGGGQPMSFQRSDEKYVLLYNGELYNTLELRIDLEHRGYSFEGHSDTEVLLKAYVEWGEGCLERLNGIFAFTVWDELRESLFLARDRLGVKPLFYFYNGSDFIFGSELKALLAHPAVEPVVEAEGMAEILVMGPSRTPGHGIFKNVFELKPGHFLKIERTGLTQRCYWALVSKPHHDDLDTTARTVRDLVEDSLKRQLISDVPLSTFLSGGLDSTILTTYASRAYKAANRLLHTYSVDYMGSNRYFKNSEFQPEPDSPWVDYVSESLGTDHHKITIHAAELVDSLSESTYARDLPGMADVDSSLLLFCRQVKKDVTVVLSGECADEIFGGYPWFIQEAEKPADQFPWVRALERRRSLLNPEVVQYIQPEAYLRCRYEEALAEVPRLKGEEPLEARMRELFYMNITRFMPTLLDRKDRMSMAVGLEARVPYCDHRLVEYTWNIPWSFKRYRGEEKGILRLAMNGEIPEAVLHRKKSPYPITHNPLFNQTVRRKLIHILDQHDSPLLGLIHPKALRAFTQSDAASDSFPWFGQLMGSSQLLAYYIQVDQWMRRYKVRLH